MVAQCRSWLALVLRPVMVLPLTAVTTVVAGVALLLIYALVPNGLRGAMRRSNGVGELLEDAPSWSNSVNGTWGMSEDDILQSTVGGRLLKAMGEFPEPSETFGRALGAFPAPGAVSPAAGLLHPAPGSYYPRPADCAGDVVSSLIFIAGSGMQTAAAVFNCARDQDTQGGRAACSRDIWAIARTAAWSAQHVTEAWYSCGNLNRECAQAIETLIGSVSLMAEAASQMARVCSTEKLKTSSLAFLACGDRLERLGWAADPLGTVTGRPLYKCYPHLNAPPYGQCVGETIASAAFLAGASIQIKYAVRVCDPKNRASYPRARCAEVVSTILRAYSISADKALQASTHCGGPNMRCGADLSKMAAALFLTSQQASRTHEACVGDPRVWKYSSDAVAFCGVFSAATFKAMAVVAAEASLAADSCRGLNTAQQACSADISKAVAAVAFMAEMISWAAADCTPEVIAKHGFFPCSRRVECLGQGVDVVSRGIGNAVSDCALRPGQPRETKPIPLPRRFWT